MSAPTLPQPLPQGEGSQISQPLRILIAAPPVGLSGETLAADIIAASRLAGLNVIVYAPVISPEEIGQPLDLGLRVVSDVTDLDLEEMVGIELALDLLDSGPREWREEKAAVLSSLGFLPSSVPLLTACNTSSATEAASYYANPASVVGFACLRPFDALKLVELLLPLQSAVAGQQGVINHTPTNDDQSVEAQLITPLQMAQNFFQMLGKETAQVADGPGGVLPRIVAMLANEAAYAVMEGVATAADIDTAMKLGANYPYGPLEWADLIGLDVVHATLWGLQQETGDDRYRPCALLTRMVTAGMRGRASGRGFYEYN